MRDVHDWEADFLDYQTHREDVEAKQYPQAFIDMLTASTKVIEGGGGGEAGASGSSPSASGSSDDAAGSASASSSSAPLSAFYSGAQTAAAAASDAEAQASSALAGGYTERDALCDLLPPEPCCRPRAAGAGSSSLPGRHPRTTSETRAHWTAPSRSAWCCLCATL